MKNPRTDKITVRLDKKTSEALDTLVGSDKFGRIHKTITDVINYAVLDYADSQDGVRVKLPENLLSQLKDLEELGDVADINNAIVDAVRFYVSQRIEDVREQNILLASFVENKNYAVGIKQKYGQL